MRQLFSNAQYVQLYCSHKYNTIHTKHILYPYSYTVIQQYIYEYLFLHYRDHQIITTVHSRDENKASIGAIIVTTHIPKTQIIYHVNSVFTAGEKTHNLVIQSFAHCGNFFTVTDSKYFIDALKCIIHGSYLHPPSTSQSSRNQTTHKCYNPSLGSRTC